MSSAEKHPNTTPQQSNTHPTQTNNPQKTMSGMNIKVDYKSDGKLKNKIKTNSS
jgi:hypothetical protein